MAAPDLRPPPRPRLRISPRSAAIAVAMFGATLAFLRLLEAAQRVIGWILVAATAAALLHPVVARLQRRMPRGLAVAVVMAGLVGAASAVGFGLVDDIQDETRRLQEAAPRRAETLERSESFGELARDLRLAERTSRFLDELPERLRGGTPAQALRAAATRGVAFLATGVLTVFLLLHGPRLAKAAARQLHNEERRARVEQVGEAVYRRAFGYARGTLAIALVAGALLGVLAAALAIAAADKLAAVNEPPAGDDEDPALPEEERRASSSSRSETTTAGASPPAPTGDQGDQEHDQEENEQLHGGTSS